MVAGGGGTLTLDGNWGNSGTVEINGSTLAIPGSVRASNLGVLAGTNGVVAVSGSVDNSNGTWTLGAGLELELTGGRITGGTVVVTNAPGLVAGGGGGILDGVTVLGTLDAGNSVNGSGVTITNGLVLNGTALVGNPTNNWWGGLAFAGSQALSGSGTVVFGNQGGYNAVIEVIPGSTLVIGSGITIHGQSGTVGEYPGYPWYGPTNVSVVNQGAILADSKGGTITITAQSVANSGSLGMTDGGNLSIVNLADAAGLLAGGGGTLTLSGGWANSGTITLNGSTLAVSGTVATAQFGNLAGTNGLVAVSGLVNNTNSQWVVGAGTEIELTGGRIAGGTVQVAYPPGLVVSGSGILDGVTLNGVLDVGNSVDGSGLTATNGLVLNGTALVGNPTNNWWGGIVFGGSQVFSGSGTVVFGNNGGYNALLEAVAGSTLVIGPGITIHGQSGTVGEYPSYPWYTATNVSLVNKGTISADVNQGTLNVVAQSVANSGTLEMSHGGNLQILNLDDAAGLTAGGGGTLTLSGVWGNSGTMVLNGSTLSIPGNASTAQFGTMAGTNCVVSVSGSVNNSNSVWVIDPGWELELAGGSIFGGTVVVTNGARLVMQNSGSTLVGVTVDGSLEANGSGVLNGVTLSGIMDVGNNYNGSVFTVTNGLVLNGMAWLGNPTNDWWGGMAFAGSQTLGGTGTIIFGNSGNNALVESIAGSTLRIGPGITFQGQNGTIGFAGGPWPSVTNVTVLCQGNISANTPGGVIALRGNPFSIKGSVSSPGGTVDVGYIDNTGGSFVVNQASNPLTLSGGWIHGGSLNMSNDVRLIVSSLTLDAVTVNGNLDVGTSINGARLTVTNGLTLNGTAYLGGSEISSPSYGIISFQGNQTLAGDGMVVFGSSGYNGLQLTDAGTTLIIGPGMAVRGEVGLIGGSGNYPWYGSSAVSVVNQGAITADASSSGANLAITGSRFENDGLVEVMVGGGLQPTATNVVNNGTIRIDSGLVTFPGSFAQTNGSIDVGLSSPTDYGQITFTGAAMVGGALEAHLQDDFSPAPGDAFPVINYSHNSGIYTNNSVYFTNLSLPGPQAWQTNYSLGVLTILVTPETQLGVTISVAATTVAAGSNVVLTASPSRPGSFGFQWQYDGAGIAGATNSTLVLDNITKLQSGAYTVVVSVGGAASESSPVQLGVLAPPAILAAPQAQVIHVGDTVVFNVSAAGDGILAYQWLWNGTPIPAATAPSLTLNDAGRPQGGVYTVLITNLVGAVLSPPAALTVATGSDCPGLPAGLVDWWRGEGNSYDYAGTNDLVFIGAGYTMGEVGEAFAFDGVSSALASKGKGPLSPGTNDFSIELWANFAVVNPSIPVGDGSVVLMSADEGQGDQSKWLFGQGGGQLYFFINGPGTGPVFLASGPFQPATNQWYHLAVTRGANVFGLFVDGTTVYTGTNALAVPSVNAPLAIGAGQGFYFKGALDEISLYNQALPPGEISAIYQAGSGGKCSLADTVTTSLTLTSKGLDQNGRFQMQIAGGQSGSTLTVQFSTDLKTWTQLAQIQQSSALTSCTDPSPVSGIRFYRVVSTP